MSVHVLAETAARAAAAAKRAISEDQVDDVCTVDAMVELKYNDEWLAAKICHTFSKKSPSRKKITPLDRLWNPAQPEWHRGLLRWQP